MPRHYQKKGRKWSDEDMANALKEIEKGNLSIRRSARKYRLPDSLIRQRLQKKQADAMDGSGQKPVFNADTESHLATCIYNLYSASFSLTVTSEEILDIVQNHVRANELVTPFCDGRPGHDWLERFMKRNCLPVVCHCAMLGPPPSKIPGKKWIPIWKLIDEPVETTINENFKEIVRKAPVDKPKGKRRKTIPDEQAIGDNDHLVKPPLPSAMVLIEVEGTEDCEESSMSDLSSKQATMEQTTYEVLKGVSTRAADKLFDSNGHSYTLLRKNKDSSKLWRCCVRGKDFLCPASVSESASGVFTKGLRSHNHPGEIGRKESALINKLIKENAMEDPFVSAPQVVRQVMHDIIGPRGRVLEGLNPIENFARNALNARKKLHPQEPVLDLP